MANIKEKELSKPDPGEQKANECRDILDGYGLAYKEAGQYLQVGDIPAIKGWLLHISAIRIHFTPLLRAVVPVLAEAHMAFKIPRDKTTVKRIVNGYNGLAQIGKLICVYPEDEGQALLIIKTLVNLTLAFRGPAVPTDAWLGGTVYTRFGLFNPVTMGEDNYQTIPFRLPEGLQWPFGEVKQLPSSFKKLLWNNRYKPLLILKPDVKGHVIQANYFKGPFNIKLCIIKEGIKNMWADEFGRDIVERLEWQYELYRDLAGFVPTPEIFDLWQQQGNTYLAMEFIKGEPLSDKIASIYENRCWFQLSVSNKILLLNYFLIITAVIGKLHEREYVHRDITPSNFIVTETGQIFLIDMELAYSIRLEKPSPAFKKGTPGFMSPEQEFRQIPTIKEDIYALGALLIYILTGLYPTKFSTDREQEFPAQLRFFNDNIELVMLVCECLENDPLKRPSITTIREKVRKCSARINPNLRSIQKPSIPELTSSSQLKEIINRGLAGLNNPDIMTADNIWTSSIQIDDLVGVPSIERAPNPRFDTGMTGLLYLIGLAKRLEYTIETCMIGYTRSWAYIKANALSSQEVIGPGLFDGRAGIALAINEGLNSGLLRDDNYLSSLQTCFGITALTPDLGSGIAGQALALLRCRSNLPAEFVADNLQQYVDMILEIQSKEGYWKSYSNSGKKEDIITGLSYGTAGILNFLMAYLDYTKDVGVMTAVQKGLDWLRKKAVVQKNIYGWPISTKSKTAEQWSTSNGTPGIAQTFIKAYRLLKEPSYKSIAEKALRFIPGQPILRDFTQAEGLSGLGEVYLEAFGAFQEEEWQHRAQWIKGVFEHTLLFFENETSYWSMNIFPEFEPNLMTGAAGILHFLMRTQYPDKIGSPIMGIN